LSNLCIMTRILTAIYNMSELCSFTASKFLFYAENLCPGLHEKKNSISCQTPENKGISLLSNNISSTKILNQYMKQYLFQKMAEVRQLC